MQNDTVVAVGFDPVLSFIEESVGDYELCVFLIGQFERTVTVQVASNPRTSLGNIITLLQLYSIIDMHSFFTDFEFSGPVTIVFSEESNSSLDDALLECFSVAIIDDIIVEPDESFTFSLIISDPQVLTSENDSIATVFIEDDDCKPCVKEC